MIEAIQEYFIPCLINMVAWIIMLSNLVKIKINIKNYKIYLALILLTLIGIFNFAYIDDFSRLLFISLTFIVANYFLFRNSIKETIISTLIGQGIVILSEVIVVMILMMVFKEDKMYIMNTFYGELITNICISILMVIISRMKIIGKLYTKTLKVTNKIGVKALTIFIIILILSINILLFSSYISMDTMNMFIINLFLIILYCSIFYIAMNEKNENIKFKEENKHLLNNLNEYEKMLDYQRVSNHENKNQLLVIKSMINKNNKKLHSYIDEVINEKRTDNETLYTRAKRIPSGGLQGLIYQKMLRMQDENINIDLNISTEVRKIDLSKLDTKTNFDICRVIGIIIDNAIDETLKIEEKEISISMYKEENDFIIEVANKCKEVPDLYTIDNKGYTTKEKGHGYGLSLLKNICDNNKDIFNERKIIGNIFLQIIKIKM